MSATAPAMLGARLMSRWRGAAVLASARKRGSTLRSAFDATDIARDTGLPYATVRRHIERLIADGDWPYAEKSEGIWRDPRPWYERIARVVTAADILDGEGD